MPSSPRPAVSCDEQEQLAQTPPQSNQCNFQCKNGIKISWFVFTKGTEPGRAAKKSRPCISKFTNIDVNLNLANGVLWCTTLWLFILFRNENSEHLSVYLNVCRPQQNTYHQQKHAALCLDLALARSTSFIVIFHASLAWRRKHMQHIFIYALPNWMHVSDGGLVLHRSHSKLLFHCVLKCRAFKGSLFCIKCTGFQPLFVRSHFSSSTDFNLYDDWKLFLNRKTVEI